MLIRKIKNIFSGKIAFFIGLLIVLIPVYFITRNLSNYELIAGGDFYQLYEPEKHLTKYFFAWINRVGQGSFNSVSPSSGLYYLESLVTSIGFTKILNFPLFFLLILSYISFFYSIKKLSPDISKFWRTALSVFYSYNYMTLSIVTYPWGFTHYYIFYIFIPPILATYIDLLNVKKLELNTLLIFVIINSLAFIGYSNLAFLFALLIIEFLILVAILISTRNDNALSIIKRAVACVVLQLTLVAPYLYSFASANVDNIDKANKTEVFGGSLEGWNIYTSSTFVDSSIMHLISGSQLPLIPVYIILPLILFYGVYKNKLENNKYIVQISILLFLILFSTKYNNPFEPIFRFLFRLPLTSMLRSPEKMFIFLPFFYIFLISQILATNKSKILRALVGILIVVSLSYFMGDSATKYLTSPRKGYKYAINIPGEYKEFSTDINTTKKNTTVISLPYSVKNSINWSNYPKWNFVGHDILHLLFDRNYISANVFDHPMLETNMTFRNLWKNSECCGDDYIEESFDRFGVEYVIWHKDIDMGRFQENLPVYEMLQNLVKNGFIRKIEDNDYFEAYKVSENKIQPLIFAEKSKITFKKINPTKYIVDINGLKMGDRVVFKQSFNPEWQVYPTKETVGNCFENYKYDTRETVECLSFSNDFVFTDVEYIFKKPLRLEHTMVDEYANSWVLDETNMNIIKNLDSTEINEDGSVDTSLVIYFRPQSLLIIQYLLLAFTLIVSTVLLIFKSRKKSKELII